MLPKLTLILGGASSGKSRFAETLIQSSSIAPRLYIATAQPFDAEMRAKIAAHRAQRGPDWHTIEAPMDLAAALALAPPDCVILIDCATLWLTNQMLAETNLATATATLLSALHTCPAPILIVSNEVGQGIVPDNPLARRFRNEQGRLNQRLAAAADLAVFVIAGLPQVLKGRLP